MTSLTTLRGTPAYAAGKFGNAMSGGVLGTSTANVWSSPVGTVEAWIRTTSSAAIAAFGCGAGSTINQWVGVSGGNAFWRDGTYVAPPTAPVNDGNWHHLAVTFDGSNVRLWVDGVLKQTTSRPSSTMAFANPVGIGGLGGNPGGEWVGDVDEVRISKVVRYTAPFTPQTTAFDVDADTISLYHLEASGLDSAGAIEVSAPAPTFTDPAGTGSDTFTIPTATGVDYKVGGVTKTAGTYPASGAVTITAFAQSGYTLIGTTSWSHTFSAAARIAPNDSNLVYSPGNWAVAPSGAKTINPGAYCRALIRTASIVLNFDMTGIPAETPQLIYRVDGGPATIVTLAASIALSIPTGIGWGVHTVEFWVKAVNGTDRWSTDGQSIRFLGIDVTGESTGTLPLTPRPLKGIAFGDSITNGDRTRDAIAGKTFTEIGDGTLGWAYQAGIALGAEIGVVGFSSQGWVNGGASGAPAFRDTWNMLWSGSPRTFPADLDFVVINHGTNGTAVQADIQSVLTAILAGTPTTTQVVVLRPFNGAKSAAISAAVAAIASPRLTYVDTTGWWNSADASDGIHPYGYASIATLGPKTADAVRTKLTGPAGSSVEYINKGGVAVMVAGWLKA